jgi:nucleotide-binding universal stress UspA family protein
VNKVYACLDGRTDTAAVIDWAVWAARRLAIPLEFVHVLGHLPGHGVVGDFGASTGLASQEAALQELSVLDEQQARWAQEFGQALLAAACERAAAAGLAHHGSRLRHGELCATAQDLEGDARLFVLGQHPQAGATSRMHMDHHVEQLVRALHRPVLVVCADHFLPPERVVVAFDGSPTAQRIVERVAASPLLLGLPLVLAMAATDVAAARKRLTRACEHLRTAGFDVTAELHQGLPQDVLRQVLSSHAAGLLVMGAYAHSRIREFVLGSTTTALLRTSSVPVLVLH